MLGSTEQVAEASPPQGGTEARAVRQSETLQVETSSMRVDDPKNGTGKHKQTPLDIWRYSMISAGGQNAIRDATKIAEIELKCKEEFVRQGGELVDNDFPPTLPEDISEFDVRYLIWQKIMSERADRASVPGLGLTGTSVVAEWMSQFLSSGITQLPNQADGIDVFVPENSELSFLVTIVRMEGSEFNIDCRTASGTTIPTAESKKANRPVGSDGKVAPSTTGVKKYPERIGSIVLRKGDEILARSDSHLTLEFSGIHSMSVAQLYAAKYSEGNGYRNSGCKEGTLDAGEPILESGKSGPFQDSRSADAKKEGVAFRNSHAHIDQKPILRIGAFQVSKDKESVFLVYGQSDMEMRRIAHCNYCDKPRLTMENGKRMIGAHLGKDRPLCAC